MSKSSTQMVGIKRNPFTTKKHKNKKKHGHRKKQKQIKMLFEKLRNESNTTLNSTNDLTPVNNTVIVLDDTIKQCPQKRKLSNSSIGEETVSKKATTESIILNEYLQRANTQAATKNKNDPSDSIIITDDTEAQNNNSVCNPSSKRTVTLSDKNLQILVVPDDDDVLQINPEPCSSKSPRRKGIAPPMNCSTPINKSKTSPVCNNNADNTKNLNVDSNETRVINRDSFLTIDLTTESNLSRLQCSTVIDLDNTQESQDCTFVSMSNASSMSGDSQVTVLQKNSPQSKRLNKFVSGIAKLDAFEKGKLLEMITEKIFSGCKVPERLNANKANAMDTTNQATETAENTYIKEVILGQKTSRNSIGSNIYNPQKDAKNKTGLRMIVIDGSNVAMSHGRGRFFSVWGLKTCIDFFLRRGHTVKAFVPRFRCKSGKSSDPRLLDELERRGFVVYTPSREIQGRLIAPYDDRYIVQCAAEFDGVIVSGDNYRDLLQENPRWRSVIENSVLPFTWVKNMIMFPNDPLGWQGPTLEQFLRHPAPKSIPNSTAQ